MGEEIDIFKSFIRRKGLRNTPEREEIIAEIFVTDDHFDVDELYLRMRSKGSRVSKSAGSSKKSGTKMAICIMSLFTVKAIIVISVASSVAKLLSSLKKNCK
jgi:hypothetical protein